jgi:hypothetical protein
VCTGWLAWARVKWIIGAAIVAGLISAGIVTFGRRANAASRPRPAQSARTGAASLGRPRLSERRILRIALDAAKRADDRHPWLIQHSAESTRARANLVDSGAIVPGGAWSYVVAATGHFVLWDAKVPAHSPVPSGSVLTLVIDARSGHVTDSGVSHRFPDLGSLGPVTTDLAGVVASPDVVGLSLDHAYSELRRSGLRVSFPNSFDPGCLPTVSAQRPRAGEPVRGASTTVLTLRIVGCALGSPAVPVGPLPSATVPRFMGRPLLAAVAWVNKHQLSVQITDGLPGLRNADAPQLLANYRITSQRPRPGATLTLGIGHSNASEGTWLPTPLRISCRQR